MQLSLFFSPQHKTTNSYRPSNWWSQRLSKFYTKFIYSNIQNNKILLWQGSKTITFYPSVVAYFITFYWSQFYNFFDGPQKYQRNWQRTYWPCQFNHLTIWLLTYFPIFNHCRESLALLGFIPTENQPCGAILTHS